MVFYVDEREIVWKELRSDTYMQTYFQWKKLTVWGPSEVAVLYFSSFF